MGREGLHSFTLSKPTWSYFWSMSHFSENPASVRVDFFTPMGKWKYTEAVLWTGAYSGKTDIHEQFRVALQDHLGHQKPRLSGLRAVCIEPYHENAHPITCMVDWGMFDGPVDDATGGMSRR